LLEPTPSSAPATLPLEDEYIQTNESALLGRRQFERGYYGLSERYFREAVEKNPRDIDSWIGLGASYDKLKRFELSDRAYGEAYRLGGTSAALLNNMGFSYMLRGNFKRARATYQRALQLDPKNEVVLNNIRILDGAQQPVPIPQP
jgi:Flp pilus assembly protein TadD